MSDNIDIISYDLLIKEIRKYIKSIDSIALIDKAYEYAKEMHKDQFRKSGEPYFEHLKCVAFELALLRVGPVTLCAGLLHDVCEDCGISYDLLKELFNEDIANLVEAVTKIGNLKFKDEKEYQAANHRKIFIAMAKDIRVIIIKLVDRLHNMRTLKYMSVDKQTKISKETLEVYAPIAHRLGFSEIKNELEDLSFYYLNQQEYYLIAKQLEDKKRERDGQVANMIDHISDILNSHRISFNVFGRSKHIYSIHKKMVTKDKRFDEILDLLAIRIICENELNCYEILGYIHAEYKPIPGRLKDYIASPKPNLYQSIHTTVIANDGNIYEIQIRTKDMDLVADRGIAAHFKYKENRKYDPKLEQKEIEDKLTWFKDLINMTQDYDEDNPSLYMETLTKDVFEANVYVMTPKGRVIDLPNGSTPIDFAYRIHTEVGHNSIGAIVNGVLVPINSKLKTGDIIEMRTNKNSLPSEDWLKFVKTSHAKNKIRSFLTKKEVEHKQEFVKVGENMLKEELKKRGFDHSLYLDTKKIENIMSNFKFNSYIDFMYAIATKSLSLQNVIVKLTNVKKSAFDFDSLTNIINNRKKSTKFNKDTGVSVGGIDSMKSQLSVCCNPVYGDDIVGYVSKGYGVKIHRVDCPNIIKERSRLIDAKWDIDHQLKKYTTNIEIKSKDRNLLLSDLITVLAQCKANIVNINSKVNNDDLTVLTSTLIQVEDLEHLYHVINSIRNVSNVLYVERVFK